MRLFAAERCDEFWMESYLPVSKDETQRWVMRCYDHRGGVLLAEHEVPLTEDMVHRQPAVVDMQAMVEALDIVVRLARLAVRSKLC